MTYNNHENSTLFNRKTGKGPSAKDYFNTDANMDRSKRGTQQSLGGVGSELAEASNKGVKANVSVYEQYARILEGIVMHKVLLECQEVPLFLQMPNENTRNQKAINNEFKADGFTNFNIILQKLKSKKYGPGNKIKTESIAADVRRVFNVCEKYYSYDANSIRISRTLESFFENEINKLNKSKPGNEGDYTGTISFPAKIENKKKNGKF